jgi:hypothetical protein
MGTQNRANPFRIPVAKPKKLGPEVNPWFWNPNNPSVRTAPESFLRRLSELGNDLAITWTPIQERWLVWAKAPRIQNPICQGWRLLFIHNGPDGEYAPLDERVFARLYASSVYEHGSAKQYFARIQAEMERDRERKDARQRQDAIDIAMPYWEHSQIKNIGKGNKFSTYFA